MFGRIDTKLTYEYLKKKALKYLDRIGGEKWDDYEEHDPGITILEELCFAIMDLDYRLSFSVEDILADNPGASNDRIRFFEACDILPSSPVTLNDYYKIILDIDHVRNCRIIPIRDRDKVIGCYRVLLCIEPHDEYTCNKVLGLVKNKLLSNRNLCEDFSTITTFDFIDVYLDLSFVLDIRGDIDCEGLVSRILVCVQEFFIPAVRFSSLSEALQKRSIDDVFNGPNLEHGFILDDDLKKIMLKTEFNIVDVLSAISSIPNVSNILSFSLYRSANNEPIRNILKVREDQLVRLIFKQSNVKIFTSTMSVVETDKVKLVMMAKRLYNINNKKPLHDEKIGIHDGNYRNLYKCDSIQNDFPLIYSVGQEGCSSDYTKQQIDQVKQFKGYLMFFDQFIKLYLSTLDNIKNYLSISANRRCYTPITLPDGVSSLNDILKKPNLNGPQNDPFLLHLKYFDIRFSHEHSGLHESCESYLMIILKYLSKTHRSDILSHLLSRFSEELQYSDFSHLDGKNEAHKMMQDLLSNYVELSRDRFKAIEIGGKSWESTHVSAFEQKLSFYLQIQNLRKRLLHRELSKSFHIKRGLKRSLFDDGDFSYSQSSNFAWEFSGKYSSIMDIVLLYGGNDKNYRIVKSDDDVSFCIELVFDELHNKYLTLKNGPREIKTRDTAKSIIHDLSSYLKRFNRDIEGFHMVENILLRTSDKRDNGQYDLYSHRISILFPNWPARFQQVSFRQKVEAWIRDNGPIHIAFDILWLNYEQMKQFEYMYKHWYEVRINEGANVNDLNTVSANLFNLIQGFIKLNGR